LFLAGVSAGAKGIMAMRRPRPKAFLITVGRMSRYIEI
jgi:hypothetical protein